MTQCPQRDVLKGTVLLRTFLKYICQISARYPSVSTTSAKCVPCGTTRATDDGSRFSTLWVPLMSKTTIIAPAITRNISRPSYASKEVKWLVGTNQLKLFALSGKIHDRETFMKGIDYSYYYEQED